MLKPVGAECNLDCGYCYYSDKAARYSGRMSEALLEKCLKDYLTSTDVPDPSVCWHGGEPLLAGIGFYRNALDIERRYSGGRRVLNTIQTNGTLLTAEWAGFLADNNFLTGLSLDGPQDLHDAFRLDRSGGGSFEAVMQAADRLRAAGAEFNTLSVVHCGSEGRGAQIYRFLRDVAHSRYMQFLPVEGGQLSAAAYGRFLCDIFDVWSKGDIGKVFVQIFDATLARWCGAVPGLCTIAESCGDNLLVECNGDVYACDRFTAPEQRLGNLAETRLADLYDDARCLHFRQAKKGMLPPGCNDCEWLHICNGGCPAQRFTDRENRLCQGLKMYFRHVAPAMERMRLALLRNESPV